MTKFLIHTSQEKGKYQYSKIIEKESLKAVKEWLEDEFISYIIEAGFQSSGLETITVYQIAHQETVDMEHFNSMVNKMIREEIEEKNEQADRALYERLVQKYEGAKSEKIHKP